MSEVTVGGRRTFVALGAVGAVLALAYLAVPNEVVQYGAWLVVFSIWMAWFVFTAVEWIANADF
ncbi:MAG: hypothetical protein ACQETI_03975 [Halobacteriota archaeon]